MHSRIIQLTTRPLTADAYITESDFDSEHWFLRQIADSVDSDDDRNGTLDMLKGWMKKHDPFVGALIPFKDEDGEGFILEHEYKEAYFADKYRHFKAALDKLCSSVSLEGYSDWFTRKDMLVCMSDLIRQWRDELGIYIASDSAYELDTLDDFIRKASYGVKYYFGGTLDYHW